MDGHENLSARVSSMPVFFWPVGLHLQLKMTCLEVAIREAFVCETTDN
jgi:hypothetical protein